MTLAILDLATETGRRGLDERIARLRSTAALAGPEATAVAQILADVRARGDEAVVECMRRWTDPGFEVGRIRVTADELARADAELAPALRRSLEAAIANVRAYQEHIRPTPPGLLRLAGAELGLRYTPVESVGLTVPGGVAVLVSTLVMLAVPALVAGVDSRRIHVVNPPPTREPGRPAGDVSPVVLAACRMLGIEHVYRIGGAQAVAALAYGTSSVEPVALIAGPGNVYVQLAKQLVSGHVGSDGGFYGPSEIVTIADASAEPGWVASDLIAQAEHAPGKCFLVAWSRPVIDSIAKQVELRLARRSRRTAIEKALREDSAAVLVADESQAAQVADRLAAEHVNLAVADPVAWLPCLRNGGEFFLGDHSPVAAGDYYAGPSHCLPTGTTARFASGISVHTFLKRSATVHYRDGLPEAAIETIASLAELEGLDAHADSARARRERGKERRS